MVLRRSTKYQSKNTRNITYFKEDCMKKTYKSPELIDRGSATEATLEAVTGDQEIAGDLPEKSGLL